MQNIKPSSETKLCNEVVFMELTLDISTLKSPPIRQYCICSNYHNNIVNAQYYS